MNIPLLISATVEASNFKFGMQLVFGEYVTITTLVPNLVGAGWATGAPQQLCGPHTSVVTKAVPETEAKTEIEAVASKTEARTEAVDPKAKAARQLIGIGRSIPINIKYR